MRRQNPPEIDGMPTGGIWYYVWLKPNWYLMTAFNERVQHMLYWPEEVVPLLAEHYELTPDEARRLKPLYASMPRGRVTLKSYNVKDGVYLAHGGDFPKKHGSVKSQIGDILSKFSLTKIADAGKVEVVEHEHEMMLVDHKKRLQKIIGRVPA